MQFVLVHFAHVGPRAGRGAAASGDVAMGVMSVSSEGITSGQAALSHGGSDVARPWIVFVDHRVRCERSSGLDQGLGASLFGDGHPRASTPRAAHTTARSYARTTIMLAFPRETERDVKSWSPLRANGHRGLGGSLRWTPWQSRPRWRARVHAARAPVDR